MRSTTPVMVAGAAGAGMAQKITKGTAPEELIAPRAAPARLGALSFRRCFFPGLVLLGLAWARPVAAADGGDEAALRRLNDDYLRASLNCDVARFRALLADDFCGVLADGHVISKAQFLVLATRPPTLKDFQVKEVTVRLYGDAALVNDLASYRRPDGSPAQTRYVDVYARRAGGWQLVSVQITHVAPAGP